jgi:hypothetical protein
MSVGHIPLVTVDLDVRERELLSAGLDGWSGTARPTDALAVALGFTDVTHLLEEADRIGTLVRDGAAVSCLDAARALAATEIAFSSDVFGAGVEWETTSGLSDVDTIRTLRVLQRKLASEYNVAADGITETD